MGYIKAPNINMFLYMPVVEGMWKQHELWDGTYVLDDLLDIHEALWVKARNMQIAYESAKEQE